MKKHLGLIYIAFVLIGFSLVYGCGADTTVADNEKTLEDEIIERADSTVELPDYEIALIEDLSFGRDDKTKRFAWHIIITEPVTSEQLIYLSEILLEQAKEREPFNALVLFYYDYEEYIGSGYTLGKAEYAPLGDWSKADTVRTGNYKNMAFHWNLRNKDWSEQLTLDEVKVFALWNEIFDSLVTDESMPSDEEVDKLVALELNIEPDAVKSIVWKQLDWTFLDE